MDGNAALSGFGEGGVFVVEAGLEDGGVTARHSCRMDARPGIVYLVFTARKVSRLNPSSGGYTMPQPVHTLRAVFFALAVTVALGFGVAQASASPPAPSMRAAACDEATCDYLCGGLGRCRSGFCTCY